MPCEANTITHPCRFNSHFLARKMYSNVAICLILAYLRVCHAMSVLYTLFNSPEAMASPVKIPLPVDFADFSPPGRIIVQSCVRAFVRYGHHEEISLVKCFYDFNYVSHGCRLFQVRQDFSPRSFEPYCFFGRTYHVSVCLQISFCLVLLSDHALEKGVHLVTHC